MSMEDQDPQVLNYNGVVLNMSDLDCLEGPHYLTDSLIHFYFSYLTSIYDEDDDIFLVPPSISFLLANSWNSEAEIRAIGESNQLGRRKVVIFTVNNKEDTSRDDQLHWSLLVYFRKSNAFVHYDSVEGFNKLTARKLYTAAKKLVAAAATQEPAPAAAPQTPTRAATSSLVTNFRKQLQRFKNYPEKMLQFGAFVIFCILSIYFHLFRDNHPSKVRSNLVTNFSKQLQRYKNYPKKMLQFGAFVIICILSIYFPLFRENHPSKVRYPLQKNINYNDEDDDDDDDGDPWFREEDDMPQQTNSYDCGIYVMNVAKLVCQWYYDEKRADQQQQRRHKRDNRFPSITTNLNNWMSRSEMLQLIERHIRHNSN